MFGRSVPTLALDAIYGSSLNIQNSTLNTAFKANPAAPNNAAKAAATKGTTLALTIKNALFALISIFLWVLWIPWQRS